MSNNISRFAIHVEDVARARRFYEQALGFECTIGVANIDQTIRAIEGNGGTIVMAKFQIPTVGSGVYFHDTEGNHVGAMQYENKL